MYGIGSNIRDWLYVDDHCSAIDVVLRLGRIGQTYNVGGANERANIDICKTICRLMNERYRRAESFENLITFVPDRPVHDLRYALVNRIISAPLGWFPTHSFEQCLIQTIDRLPPMNFY